LNLLSFLKKCFELFVFTSLFIAVCAVLMAYQAAMLFSFDLSFVLAGFVFSGTVCSYNFHWYLTPPGIEQLSPKLAWNISNRKLHFFLFILGGIGAGVFGLLLIQHWKLLLLTAAFTFLYSAPKIKHPLFSQLKKIAIGKTIYLAFAWTHVTALLPLLMNVGHFSWVHLVYVINRFFFIYAICILFDYRDVEHDRRAGIKSLITYLNKKQIHRLFWFSVGIAFATTIIMLNEFLLPDVIALLIPVIILALLYRRAQRNFSDYFYYFVLDGLMMLSAPLLLLTKFAR
jgi:4-hydroxybenzoate polyprenyltransferase